MRIFNGVILIILVSSCLSSCQSGAMGFEESPYRKSSNYAKTYRALSREDRGNNHYKGHYKVGKPYKINGKKYKPKEVTRYIRNGIASWYGKRYNFHGSHTANGSIFNKEMLTAAHKTLPLPSLVKVTNRENGKSIIVLVNDRGPFAYNREIDLSERAAERLDMKNQGTAKVRVQYLHTETQKFLKILGLDRRPGSKAERPLKNKRCTVNCHIKLVNIKHKLL